MKIPNIDCKVEITCMVNPSEDIEKIKKSISNILPNSKIELKNFLIYAQSKDLYSFEKFYDVIRSKKSYKTYARNLENNLKNNSTWFYVNKQAAFVEQIAICEEAGESPLGPLKVTLTSSNIDEIIDWIVFND